MPELSKNKYMTHDNLDYPAKNYLDWMSNVNAYIRKEVLGAAQIA